MRPDEFVIRLFQVTCFEFKSPAIIVSVVVFSRISRSAVRSGVLGLLYTAINLSSEFPRLMWTMVLVIDVVGMCMR